jgi:hypothetical protein
LAGFEAGDYLKLPSQFLAALRVDDLHARWIDAQRRDSVEVEAKLDQGRSWLGRFKSNGRCEVALTRPRFQLDLDVRFASGVNPLRAFGANAIATKTFHREMN